MHEWMRKLIGCLAGVLVVAVMVRLAWELLRPALPVVIALLVVLVIVRLVLATVTGVVSRQGGPAMLPLAVVESTIRLD